MARGTELSAIIIKKKVPVSQFERLLWDSKFEDVPKKIFLSKQPT
jgi:hypothetical protein